MEQYKCKITITIDLFSGKISVLTENFSKKSNAIEILENVLLNLKNS